MKQKGDRIKEEEEEEEEEEEWEITHISMAFQHSLTRSRIHIPHTSSIVIRSWHDPKTIKQGTDTPDPLMKNGREESENRVREWNRKEIESKRKNGRSLTSPWPSNTRSQDPVSTSHTRTVLSSDPDTTRRPSGKAQTLVTL
jgi:hypothetical protein